MSQTKEAGYPVVMGEDDSGALYGCLELAKRIRELDGRLEGSMKFKASQTTNQPPEDSTDLSAVIKGVIDAEQSAVNLYKSLIGLTDGDDYVTQDLCIRLLASEEEHLREFKGFMRAIEAGR